MANMGKVIALLFVQFGLVFGISRDNTFSSIVNNICYEAYSDVISDVYGVVSITKCSTICSEATCCSFMYDKSAKRCITYYTQSRTTTTGCYLKYAEKDSTICQTGPCTQGYSYDFGTKQCKSSCVTYGRTFGTFKGYVLGGHNNVKIYNRSEQECKNACVLATSFTCRSAEFDYTDHTCYLSTETALTQPNDYRQNSSYIFWHRNCALNLLFAEF